MNEIADFGLIVLVVAASFTLALFGRAITERFAIPSAGLFLLAAAVASDRPPAPDPLSRRARHLRLGGAIRSTSRTRARRG